MRPVYSTRFFSVAGASSAIGEFVPAGYVAVLRDVWVYAGNQVTPVAFALLSGTSAKMWAIESPPLTPMYWYWQGRQVYQPGEFMEFVITSGNVDVSASGYLLTLP